MRGQLLFDAFARIGTATSQTLVQHTRQCIDVYTGIDVTGPEPVEHRGYVPPRSIVVPGTRPKEFPAGTYHLACALIIGQRRESTDLKTSLNDALREHGIGTG